MRKALHPDKNVLISVTEYIKDFGNDNPPKEERARCPLCQQYMSIVAPSTPSSTGHFAHLPRSDFCPTKSGAGSPYAGLYPKHPDMESAKLIRKEFCNTWEMHYKKLDSIVIGLSLDEFLEILNLSLKERIWEYSNLELHQIPYIFFTMIDFPPEKSYKKKDGSFVRQYWFRCWFDNSISCYDDLWIHRASPLSFWRGSYRPQAGRRKPRIEDIVKFYEIEMSNDFLNVDRGEVKLPGFVVKKVETYLDKHFAEP